MSMDSKLNASIKSNIKLVMNNKTPLYILTGCVLLYVLILPNIDYDLLQLINSVPVKMIFAVLIIYTSTISPCIGIMILLIYVLSIQQYNNVKSVEGFTSIIDKIYGNLKDLFKTNDSPPPDKNISVQNLEEKDTNENEYDNTDLGELCGCPLVKDQPKHKNNKDPKDSRDYKIDDLPIFTPIVPVRD